MKRALIAIEDIDRDRALLERARAFAFSERIDLVVVALATPGEYEEVEETLDAIGRVEHTHYDEHDVLEGISGDVDDMANDVLGSSVDYELETVVAERSNQATTLLEIADRSGCDHVFVPGTSRSPTGKAVFGDRTQDVILGFDGFVTVSME
ncbi:universal stress protein [Haloferax sp. DFSO52]|uniref:universal stress protein n=1 Tax=Haloferax sp. DFSO52 TaxID=3388505 RepID=UPI003A853493